MSDDTDGMENARAELDALKARRCDGCAHYDPMRAPATGRGYCDHPDLMVCPTGNPDDLCSGIVDDDHNCKKWEPRNPAQIAP